MLGLKCIKVEEYGDKTVVMFDQDVHKGPKPFEVQPNGQLTLAWVQKDLKFKVGQCYELHIMDELAALAAVDEVNELLQKIGKLEKQLDTVMNQKPVEAPTQPAE